MTNLKFLSALNITVITTISTISANAFSQDTLSQQNPIVIEVSRNFDLYNGNVRSIDDLGIGNLQDATIEELQKLYPTKKQSTDLVPIYNLIEILKDNEFNFPEKIKNYDNLFIHEFKIKSTTSNQKDKRPLAYTNLFFQDKNPYIENEINTLPIMTETYIQPKDAGEILLEYINKGKPNGYEEIESDTRDFLIIEKSTKASKSNKGIKKSNDKTIYGKDDRMEIYDINWTEAMHLSKGVASISNLTNDGKYGKGFCTGFLIGEDKAITNSHCINNETIKSVSFRFGDEYIAPGIYEEMKSFSVDSIIIWDKSLDIALVKLNKNLSGVNAGDIFPALPLSKTPREKGTPIYMIGHPEGAMKKFTPNCEIIRRPYKDEEFGKFILGVDCDAFGGNSGSPIFDASTHEVIAFLWGGQMDTQTFETADENIHEFAIPIEILSSYNSFRFGEWPKDISIR